MTRTLLYVAYPMKLDLRAANAIQTYNTVRELQAILPGTRLIVPRWLRESSAFSELEALHLPRPAVNKLSRVVPWAGWSYVERTIYSFMLASLLLVWRVLRRSYPLIYVRDAVCAAWLALLKPLHGSRLIYEVHDLEAAHPSNASRWPRAFWRRVLPRLDHAALTRSDRLVSLTRAFKRWLTRRGTRKAGDVEVIPDAFDPALYYPGDAHEARDLLHLPEGGFIVGYAGLTFAYRGVDLLVKAFAELAEKYNDLLLLLVGGREHEVAEMRKLALDLGIPGEQLMMPGQVDQERTALYVCASDVLVIPGTVTHMTASPLKLFEYMAVGKPIVCKDMPALREIVDEKSALFFQPGSTQDLACAIETLKNEAERARNLGEDARNRSAQYTYRARAERIKEVVCSCLR